MSKSKGPFLAWPVDATCEEGRAALVVLRRGLIHACGQNTRADTKRFIGRLAAAVEQGERVAKERRLT